MDPIGDLLTRMRNGYLARKEEISLPYSKLKADILKDLKLERRKDWIAPEFN